MTSGLKLVNDYGINPQDFTVADATAIEKGDICMLVDPRTASGASVISGQMIAGVAAAEKVANDGAVNVSLHRFGIWDASYSGAAGCAAGDTLMASDDNHVTKASKIVGHASGASIIGHALEDAAAGELFEFELKIGGH